MRAVHTVSMYMTQRRWCSIAPIILLFVFMSGCSSDLALMSSLVSGSGPTSSNDPPPNVQLTLSSLSPSQLSLPLSGDLPLTAEGTGFTAQSELVFNGTQLITVLSKAGQLSATLPTALITRPGSYPVYVWKLANHSERSNSISVTVAAAPPSFTVTVSPASLSINQWAGGQATIAVAPQNGFSGNVTFSVSGVPAPLIASFTAQTENASILSIQATDDLQPGVATVTITGTSGSISASTTLSLSLVELPVVRDENGYCSTNGSWTGLAVDGNSNLPQTCVYTDLIATPSPGDVIPLSAGGNLQDALNAANCGDTITLEAGASFSLNAAPLTSKGCDDQHWITVRTSAPDSSLPPEHARINPSYAGVLSLPSRPPFSGGVANVMAQILETGPAEPLILGDHFRLIGVEITRLSNGKPYDELVHTQTSHVILDRCWIHGDDLDDTAHLVQIGPGSDHIAVIDSYLNDAHCATTGACIDSQAVGGHDGGTTIKIVNNFLEAAGENILFGGGPATTITTDIEIRLNHFYKPMSWNPLDPTFIGKKFIVKNNLEFKEGQRVLVEGNLLQNTWGGYSQTGVNILVGPKNQEEKNGANGCPICLIADMTIRYDYVQHGSGVIDVGDGPNHNGAWAGPAYDYSIHDLIGDGMQYSECYECGNFLTLVGSGYKPNNPPPSTSILHNVSLNHLTVVNVGFLASNKEATGFMRMSGPPANNPTNTPQITNLSWTNSIIDAGDSGAYPTGGGKEDNCSVGESTVAGRIAACWEGSSSFTSNLLVTDYAASNLGFPQGNEISTTWSDVDFIDFNGGDGGNYQLSPTSPYKGTATDGTDPGADVTAVMAPMWFVE